MDLNQDFQEMLVLPSRVYAIVARFECELDDDNIPLLLEALRNANGPDYLAWWCRIWHTFAGMRPGIGSPMYELQPQVMDIELEVKRHLPEVRDRLRGKIDDVVRDLNDIVANFPPPFRWDSTVPLTQTIRQWYELIGPEHPIIANILRTALKKVAYEMQGVCYEIHARARGKFIIAYRKSPLPILDNDI